MKKTKLIALLFTMLVLILAVPVSAKVTFSSMKPAKDVVIKEGTGVTISGKIKSTKKLRYIWCEMRKDNVAYYQASASNIWNKKKYTIKPNGEIDSKIKVSKLPIGEYTMRISVTDKTGKSYYYTRIIKVKGDDKTSSAIVVKNVSIPDSIKAGKSATVGAEFSSARKLAYVEGKILNSAGRMIVYTNQSCEGAKYFSVAGSKIDSGLCFGILAKGKYIVQLKAVDDKGYAKVLSKNLNIK